jgi:alkanesulfonate monooxygenase SsuD/methylene tetrahydromethanopterin reductase-like flavin-dependent oxidoreductase (luciferase family)
MKEVCLKTRGFALEATTPPEGAVEIALKAEEAGYASMWSNDLPHADGVRLALAIVASTSSIDVGVGVIALDRRPPPEVEKAIETADRARLILGVGAGFSERPLDVVRNGVAELRERIPSVRIAIAAMGPKMCQLGGGLGDVILLNWMTPERISWARALIERGAEGRDVMPRVAAYVRIAIGPSAAAELLEAENHYRQMPHYARHFEAMGAEPGRVGIVENHTASIKAYEAVLDDVIIRPLGDNPEQVLELMAPRTDG